MGCHFLLQGNLPDPGIKPRSPTLWADALISEPAGKPLPGGTVVKNLPAYAGDAKKRWVRSLGQEDPLDEEMATHSRILAWKIPWTEEPGGLQSMGSKRIGHN